jgi:succinylglutamate desuccinylase
MTMKCINFWIESFRIMQKVLIVGSTHGHEKIGQYVIRELKKHFTDNSKIEYVIGNPKASEQNIPFLENDLNRIFPGKLDGTYEEQLAYELSKKIVEVDLVIDLHSTKTTDYSTNSMLIVTKLDEETHKMVRSIKPPKVLIMKCRGGNALISDAKIGIAFEYGRDNSRKVLSATLHDIGQVLAHNGLIEANPFENKNLGLETEFYEVYDGYPKTFQGILKLRRGVKNFQLVRKGEAIGTSPAGEIIVADEDFYPIMFGKNRYTNILGFKARKLLNYS